MLQAWLSNRLIRTPHLPLTQVIDFLQCLSWQEAKLQLLLLLLHAELLLCYLA